MKAWGRGVISNGSVIESTQYTQHYRMYSTFHKHDGSFSTSQGCQTKNTVLYEENSHFSFATQQPIFELGVHKY